VNRPFRLIDSASALDDCTKVLTADLAAQAAQHTPRLYLDTEFESNRTGTRLCLLQISAGGHIFVVDPLALKRVDPLAEVLGAANIEWVLHAGLQDVELITRHFSVPAPARLFDTQIAWGLLSPEASVSLAYLTYRLLQLRSEKAHQADDWVQRPLQSSQLCYAAADVEHLGELQERLLSMADKLGRTAHLYQATSEALLPPRPPRVVLSLNSFRNAWQLSPPKQAALKYIITWYNTLSHKAQRHVPDGKVLLSVAAAAPPSLSALGRIKGVSPSFVQQYGQQLVLGMQEAVGKAASADFQLLEPAPYATFEEIKLDAWLTSWRAHLAIQLQFAPELVMPSRVMKEVKTCLETQGADAIHEALDGYRRALLVEESARFCANRPPPV